MLAGAVPGDDDGDGRRPDTWGLDLLEGHFTNITKKKQKTKKLPSCGVSLFVGATYNSEIFVTTSITMQVNRN